MANFVNKSACLLKLRKDFQFIYQVDTEQIPAPSSSQL